MASMWLVGLWAAAFVSLVVSRNPTKKLDSADILGLHDKSWKDVSVKKLRAGHPLQRSAADAQAHIVESRQTSDEGVLESPDYPDNYPNNYVEVWFIEVPQGEVVSFTTEDFSLEYHSSCMWDALTIYDGAVDSAEVLAVLCGTVPGGTVLYSTSHMALVVFQTDFSVTDTGFRINYKAVPADEVPYDPVADVTAAACSADAPALVDAETPGLIASPGFPLLNYPDFSSCMWVITAPEEMHVLLHFESFHVEYHGDCTYDRVSVSEVSDDVLRGSFCGYTPPYDLISYGDALVVEFESDDWVTAAGFEIQYSATEQEPDSLPTYACPGPAFLTAPGTLTPLRDDEGFYGNDETCAWIIAVTPGKFVELEFVSFEVEYQSSCEYDRLSVYDGNNENAPILAELCGYDLPPTIHSTTNEVFLRFSTDYSVVETGFELSYTESDIQGEVSDIDAACPGEEEYSGPGFLPSPNFGLAPYPNDALCQYRITVAEDKYVEIEFLFLDIEASTGCVYDFLEFFDGPNPGQPLAAVVCGSDLPPNVVGSSNSMFLRFVSDFIVQGQGFLLEIKESDEPGLVFINQPACPGPHIVNASAEEYVYSNNYGSGGYGNSEICTWVVNAPEGQYVRLEFEDFDVENSNDCSWDRLTIFDGPDDTAGSVTYCGDDLPPNFTSTGNVAFLAFTSDAIIIRGGFLIHTAVSEEPGDELEMNQLLACPGPLHIADLDTQMITSPNYGGNYPNNAYCSYLIDAPEGMYVSLSFIFVDIEYQSNCGYDSLRIYDGRTNIDLPRSTICGSGEVDDLVSLTASFLIIFISDSSYTGYGFQIEATAVDTPGTLPDDFVPDGDACPGPMFYSSEVSTGVISSPNFGQGYYGNNEYCTWHIEAETDELIHFHFTDFSLEPDNFCRWDTLNVYECDGSQQGELVGSYCGDTLPDDIVSTGPCLHLIFESDSSITDTGFSATFMKFVPDEDLRH